MVGCPYEGRIAPEAVAMVRFRIVKIGTQCVHVATCLNVTVGQACDPFVLNNESLTLLVSRGEED